MARVDIPTHQLSNGQLLFLVPKLFVLGDREADDDAPFLIDTNAMIAHQSSSVV